MPLVYSDDIRVVPVTVSTMPLNARPKRLAKTGSKSALWFGFMSFQLEPMARAMSALMPMASTTASSI